MKSYMIWIWMCWKQQPSWVLYFYLYSALPLLLYSVCACPVPNCLYTYCVLCVVWFPGSCAHCSQENKTKKKQKQKKNKKKNKKKTKNKEKKPKKTNKSSIHLLPYFLSPVISYLLLWTDLPNTVSSVYVLYSYS